MSTTSVNLYPGIQQALSHLSSSDEIQIEDEMDGEQESFPGDQQLALDGQGLGTELRDVILGASKGVTEGTAAHYERLMAQCKKFAIEKKFVRADGEVFSKAPHRDTPLWIIAWIMDACDVIRLDASPKLSTDTRSSYSHAQKMRAAMTYAFGRVHGLGSLAWHERDDGTMQGNPSISNQVSAYMLSLRRRKVHAGEAATSARAITQDILKDLYNFNHRPENWEIKQYSPGKRKNAADQEEEVPWAGGNTRRLLFAAFTIAYLCLLRVDEVLKIKFSHLQWDAHDDNLIVLTLPFRKTSQNGDIKPFVLRRLPDYFQHLCPVRALCDWILASQLSSGYVFRKVLSGDRFSATDIAMTSEQFLELFRNSLLDIRFCMEISGGVSVDSVTGEDGAPISPT
ncbi:hypothetical protein PTI98_013551 [Pleurotus ostreatus]|nr:hypothetical protein PTI98_013551 [Pleurotus ostreatus]